MGRVVALFLGRLARTGTGTIMIDVIMIDLIAAKNPVLASGSLQGELGYALQAINVVLSAPIPRYYALTRSADTQAISQNIKHTLW